MAWLPMGDGRRGDQSAVLTETAPSASTSSRVASNTATDTTHRFGQPPSGSASVYTRSPLLAAGFSHLGDVTSTDCQDEIPDDLFSDRTRPRRGARHDV